MTLTVIPGSAGAQGGAQRAVSPQAKEPLVHGNGLPRIRVLVVDDEPSICKALTMALSYAGYDVIAALSGDSALSIVRNEHVDVMLMDLRIPDMRGDSIFYYASAIQPHLRYQTLFLTGDITDHAYKLIAACDCNFIRKPFDLNDMMAAVAALSPRMQEAAG